MTEPTNAPSSRRTTTIPTGERRKPDRADLPVPEEPDTIVLALGLGLGVGLGVSVGVGVGLGGGAPTENWAQRGCGC